MKWTAFLLATIIGVSNARAIEWALEISVTTKSGREYKEYFITAQEGAYAIKSPKGWTCALKIDKVRTIQNNMDTTILFQNAFIGCLTSDKTMVNTGASIGYTEGVSMERDTTFIIVGDGKEDLSMRLIPCFGKYRDECKTWKQSGD